MNEHPGEKERAKPRLEPVRRVRLYETIVKQIQDLISSGSLQPGERLPSERELAEELGVSRTSIREALRALESMGYLESRVGVGGGTYIKQITFSNIISPFSEALLRNDAFILELLEVRLILEIEVVRLAALRRSADHLSRLSVAVEKMRAEIESGDTGLSGDNEFHAALADAAGNTVLHEFVNTCGNLLEVEREEHLKASAEERYHALAQHEAILAAVTDQDDELAQKIMQDHIMSVSSVIRANRELRGRRAPSG